MVCFFRGFSGCVTACNGRVTDVHVRLCVDVCVACVQPGMGAVEFHTLQDTAFRFRTCLVEAFQQDYCIAKNRGNKDACVSYTDAKKACLST